MPVRAGYKSDWAMFLKNVEASALTLTVFSILMYGNFP